MDYILFGIQGSGKGTHGKVLAEKIGAVYFETGGELRRLSAENSDLGKKVKSIIDAGHLVPNEVVMEIVENFLKNKAAAYAAVFDGIPRNREQNESLTTLLKKLGREYMGIHFELSREEAEDRLLKRRICGKCKMVYSASYQKNICEKCDGQLITRADDNIDSIRIRLDIFEKETLPLVKELKTQNKMITINANGSIETITQRLFRAITS